MKNWIETYQLENGDFDISDVNKELVSQIPSAIQMGKVYQRLIVDTTLWNLKIMLMKYIGFIIVIFVI